MKKKSPPTNLWSEFRLSLTQRVFGLLAIFLVTTAFALGFVYRVQHLIAVIEVDQISLVNKNISSIKSTATTTRALFLGDIMLDRGVLGKINNAKAGYEYPFEYVTERLQQYDLVVANLEGPASDRGVLVGSKYSFRFPPIVAESLAASGIDIVSLANNHIWDYGPLALCDSVENLKQAGISSVGAGCDEATANEPALISANNQNFLFLGYTNLYPDGLVAHESVPGISDFSIDRIVETVATYREQYPDLIAVALVHWGDEYETRSHPREQVLAHSLIDAGIDLVVGHHPHVTQEIERYQDGWIFYSLGNFIFDQYFSEETMRGFGIEVSIAAGEIIDFRVLPYVINENYQPIFLDQEKWVKKI